MVHKTKKNKAKTQHNMCWTPLYETNTDNVNETRVLLKTTGGKDEPNIITESSKLTIVSLLCHTMAFYTI